MSKTKKPKTTTEEHRDVGRPTIMTPLTIQKLEQVFALGGTDKEACVYADIVPSTLYNYQQEHPEFVERKELLKEKPILKARTGIVNGLDSFQNALTFLQIKRPEEFSPPKQNNLIQVNIGSIREEFAPPKKIKEAEVKKVEKTE